jgi:hypothetical protein
VEFLVEVVVFQGAYLQVMVVLHGEEYAPLFYEFRQNLKVVSHQVT